MTFAEKVIAFNGALEFTGDLPEGIDMMNPFKRNTHVEQITREFYSRYFSDRNPRHIILGINPGRFGAGTTGIPFTDTIRLNEKCGVPFHGFRTYEPSSAFVYELIDAFGGVTDFYQKFFVSAICPLGFTRISNQGRVINYNYYDSKALLAAVYDFILVTLKKQLDFGIDTSVCFCLGAGKNALFLSRLNNEQKFFKKIIVLEHPRYIMQYKVKSKQAYIDHYLSVLRTLDS